VTNIHQKLLATFEVEHRDHIEQIRSLLARIQATGAAAGPELEEAFRRAHSLKGAARAVDVAPIEGLAHRMETLFSRVREGALSLDQEVSGAVLQALDASEDFMAAPGGSGPPESLSAALAALQRVLAADSEPLPEPGARPPAPVQVFQPVETVRIAAQNFDAVFRSADRVVAESQRQGQITEELKQLEFDLMAIETASERWSRLSRSVTANQKARRGHAEARPPMDSLEPRLRAVCRRARAIRRLHQRTSWTMRQMGQQLQRDVWAARMVPADTLLEGFRKMVRDLARDEGKKIEFHSACGGVQADRRVLEALKDPIMHLLRNAAVHGIESPQERTAQGKPPVGLVTLRIDTNGQRLTVLVQDDGRGIDFPNIARVAVRDGLLSESEAAHSSPADLTRILLRPGFSTSKAVTSLSGRGMGMSIAYEAVRRLQGDLNIEPGPRHGAAISLSVPLSIATHRLLLVKYGAQTFAVPIPGIEKLQRLKLSMIESVEGRPAVVFNGQSVRLASLASLLGLSQAVTPAASESISVMVLRSGTQKLAVAVDRFLRETDALVQGLGPAVSCGGKIASAVALEDGEIAFVLNPMELIQSSLESRAHGPIAICQGPAEPETKANPAFILIVDDSLTTRTLEKSILEAHGYQVCLAVDGVDALGCLREEKPELVIADIEMPRLNGFGLIEAMKKDPALEHIPVIIVSSVERREDQERGLSLGADAYIVKRKFDQGELLAAIRQILGAGLAP
jgi:two-component system, chemotaxis family, sensor kinase CheA